MKNIKLKIFTAAVLALLQTTVFCDNSSPPSGNNGNYGNYGSDSIVDAINALQTATMNALQGANSTSIVNVLNTIFNVPPSTGNNNTTSQSVIDKKIDGYVKNFYSLYATDKISYRTN